jgi:hypothetical protein
MYYARIVGRQLTMCEANAEKLTSFDVDSKYDYYCTF